MDTTVIVAIVVILIVIFIFFYHSGGSEHFAKPWFLNQMAMEYPDPTWFNYFGRTVRDDAGMSSQDYYLENEMNAETGVGPQYFEGASAFKDHTGYMDMPIKYRPLRHPTPQALKIQSEIESNNLEEELYRELNRGEIY